MDFKQELDATAFQLFLQQMELNRSSVIQTENNLFLEAIKNHDSVYLNLGCGDRILPGFINVDKFHLNEQVVNYDIFQLPYEKESIDAIFCAHALEHLPFRHALLALQNWTFVLKPNGYLYLGVPDLELIFEYFKKTNDWNNFIVTLFGFQTDPNNVSPELNHPVHPGHFHTNGYTKKTVRDNLEQNGFSIEELYNYDGWGTPSIWVKAKKIL